MYLTSMVSFSSHSHIALAPRFNDVAGPHKACEGNPLSMSRKSNLRQLQNLLKRNVLTSVC
jgi:hypothetical protein